MLAGVAEDHVSFQLLERDGELMSVDTVEGGSSRGQSISGGVCADFELGASAERLDESGAEAAAGLKYRRNESARRYGAARSRDTARVVIEL